MFNDSSLISFVCQAFQVVEKPPFRRLLKYLRPTLSNSDIPHRTKTRDEIMTRAKIVMERVKDKLAVRAFTFVAHLTFHTDTVN